MTTRRLVIITAVAVLLAVLLVAYVVADAAASDTPRVVATTSSITPTTAWPAETSPTLPAGFDPTKLAPRRKVKARQVRSAMPRFGGAAYPTDELLARLARCETGGTMDPRTDTGNGFYGAFQFRLGTWHSIGGTGNPVDHSYEVQRDLARALILRSGWGQFPACSRAIGAR